MTVSPWIRWLPASEWLATYSRQSLINDGLAAVIVTIMLIPQSMAYALLAGLPPEVGLYASVLPLVGYGLFGSSRVLAVGPVAVVSLLTAASLSQVATPGSPEYVGAALALALLSGAFLLLLGVLRLGALASLLSHPVISGFITASGILIAASQLKHLLGVEAHGHDLLTLLGSLFLHLPETNFVTLVIGLGATGFLFWVRSRLKPLLYRLGIRGLLAEVLTKAGPVAAVVATTLAVMAWQLEDRGVDIVGGLPQGLPALAFPPVDWALWQQLLPAAVLLSVIGFVESVSVAQTLAAKRRQRIEPNRELLGLGAANVAAALGGGYPVTGGFARSVVNFDAGAETPMAGILTAVGIALTALLLTPLFFFLPKATLAATIVVAVLSLVDIGNIKRTWRYCKIDSASQLTTIAAVLLLGVEVGVVTGVVLSIILHLGRTMRPHIAVVGRVPGTEHYRNVKRHEVITSERVLTVRIDESLYFANARYLEDRLYAQVVESPGVTDLVLLCSAVNAIDASALESLELMAMRLKDAGVRVHLSEVKGPVMDRLQRSDFFEHLTGQVFLNHHQAMVELDPGLMAGTEDAKAPSPPASALG